MILVDTCVWIENFKEPIPLLRKCTEQESIAMHPFVMGEILMGSVKDRNRLRFELENLDQVQVVEDSEVLALVERHRLFNRGISYVDAHLLASAVMAGALLWTRDTRLLTAAITLNVQFVEP